ncbi:hypothetical protein L210DRAFT_3694324, partial [Boletus edulis BED1]
MPSTPQARQRSLGNASPPSTTTRTQRPGREAITPLRYPTSHVLYQVWANYILTRDAQCRADSPLCTPTTSGASSQTHPPNLAVVLPSPQVTQGTPPLLDIYMPSTDTWPTLYPAPDGFPAAHSVHGLVPFMTSTVANRERIPIALLHHSEKDTSSVGHAGAGVFWANAWLLVVTSTSKSTPSLEWKKLRVEGTDLPEPRGWFPLHRTSTMEKRGSYSPEDYSCPTNGAVRCGSETS